ncbi:MAG: SUMF1/EgtB/PvdO family nonheme iron enzyme [Chloroflexota bacterium]
MSHIFISYSHKDKKYVEKLEAKLLEEGFNVWIDHRVDYGTKWPVEIQKALDECDAFVLVVTKNAFESEWVQNEVARAKRKGKPFFPLLLQGDTWLSVEATQYVDVTDGSLPPHKFYERLEKVTLKNKIEKTAQPPQTIKTKVSQKPNLSQNAVRVIGALIVGLAAIFGLPKLINVIGQVQVPTHIPVSTHTITLTVETPKPSTATMTSTSPLPSHILDEKGVQMVFVPAGEFIMGSENGDDEKPVHTVYLKSYYIDQYEVTNSFYMTCVNDGVCKSPSNNYYNNSAYNDHPVVNVSWYMANTYCEWRGARLPTEAEWEKAARGTDGQIYPWGNNFDHAMANLCDKNCPVIIAEPDWDDGFAKTSPVGSFPRGASQYGIYDMTGNVWEWVSSLYRPYPYDANDGREKMDTDNDQLTDSDLQRVLRGGSYSENDNKYLLRLSFRFHVSPFLGQSNWGFRCAKAVTP